MRFADRGVRCYFIPVHLCLVEDTAAGARVASQVAASPRVAAVPKKGLLTQMLKHHEPMLSYTSHVFLFPSTDQIES